VAAASVASALYSERTDVLPIWKDVPRVAIANHRPSDSLSINLEGGREKKKKGGKRGEERISQKKKKDKQKRK
jgi:hypothetical protein